MQLGDYEKGTYMAHQGILYTHPSRNRAVLLHLFDEEYSIVDFTGGEFSMVKEYKGWSEPQEEVHLEGGITYIAPTLDDKNCFMSGTTTAEYIYALYSGKLRNNELVEDPSYGITRLGLLP